MSNKLTWLLGGAITLLLLISFIKVTVIVGIVNDKSYIVSKNSFQIQWIHSVERERWDEFYNRRGNKLVLTKTILNTFGAGTPSEGKIIESDDHRVHMEVDRTMENIHLIISENVETTIVIDDKVIPLYEHFDHFSEMKIFVDRVHLFDYLRKERLYESINEG